MIPLADPGADGPLLAELKEAGILSPDVVPRIDAVLGPRECASLNQYLLAGAEFIAEAGWLAWLIRRHGCHRFGRVVWHPDAAPWVQGELPAHGNLPYRSAGDGGALVAVLRPDRMDSGNPATAHWAAATLGEVAALHSAWRAALDGTSAELRGPSCW